MTNLQTKKRSFAGAIDCDIHCTVPSASTLYKYLPEYWKNFMIDAHGPNLEPNYYPVNSALAARPGSRPPNGGPPGSDFGMVQKQALDETGVDFAVLYCLYGAQVVRNDGWAAALCSAVNDWIAEEWLSKDRRFRGSIMVPWQNVQMAVAEIERLASDRRFVQVMLLARSEILLGRAAFWPIYEAAERHGLPIAIHAGGGMGNPNMASGWNRFFAEDHLSMQQAFQAQLVSLIAEGVFSKYPGLKVVFAESGFTWLPALMWRFDKNWRGLRREVPWIDRLPSDYIREHFRFTLQPVDESPDTRQMLQVIDQLGSDELLMFSTDYPHWQYDDEGPFPLELSEDVTRKVLRSNAESIYRLG